MKLILIFWILIRILDFIYSNQMMVFSIKFINYIQQINLVMLLYPFTYYLFIFYDLCFIYCLVFKNKWKFSIIISFFIFTNVINEIQKLIYKEVRPNNYSKFILYNRCNNSYGKPSGHSSSSYLFFMLFFNFKNKIEYIKYIIIFLICFSRLYYGAHSINQIILGVLDGVVLFKFYKKYIEKYTKIDFKKNPKIIKNILLILITTYFFSLIIYLLAKWNKKITVNYCKNISLYNDVPFYIISIFLSFTIGNFLYILKNKEFNTNKNWIIKLLIFFIGFLLMRLRFNFKNSYLIIVSKSTLNLILGYLINYDINKKIKIN